MGTTAPVSSFRSSGGVVGGHIASFFVLLPVSRPLGHFGGRGAFDFCDTCDSDLCTPLCWVELVLLL